MPFDFRRLRVTFEDEESTDVFEDLAITCQGQRTGSWVQNPCTITIANIDKTTRDRLATKYRPENQLQVGSTRGAVFVDVGRESYGLFRLFEGEVVFVEVSEPPDIQLIVHVVANYYTKSDLTSKNFGFTSKLSGVAKSVADDLGLKLEFLATNDINIQNLYYSGDLNGQLKIFDEMPFIDAYQDNGKLIVKDSGAPVSDIVVTIDVDNEMIGIPKFTDYGLSVRFLIRPDVRPGSIMRIRSRLYPATNGDYVIVNLGFNVANREQPFYFDAFGTRRVNG